MIKAKYIGCLGHMPYDKYKSPIYVYEYRGIKYDVTDYRNGYSVSMYQQHHAEQSRIDALLDNKKEETIEMENASIGLNKIFNYFDSGEWED